MIGKLPEDNDLSLPVVAAAQAVIDLIELRDMGMISFQLDLDLEGLHYIVRRGAQMEMIPSRCMVANCAGLLADTVMGASVSDAEKTRTLVLKIGEVREKN